MKDQIGLLTYVVQVSGGQQWRKHVDHVRDGGTFYLDPKTLAKEKEPLDKPYPDQLQQGSSSTESEPDVSVPASPQLETATPCHPEHTSDIPSAFSITLHYPTRIRKPRECYIV